MNESYILIKIISHELLIRGNRKMTKKHPLKDIKINVKNQFQTFIEHKNPFNEKLSKILINN